MLKKNRKSIAKAATKKAAAAALDTGSSYLLQLALGPKNDDEDGG